MKRNKFILILVLAIVFSIFLTKFIFYSFYVLDVQELDIYVDVIDQDGAVGMDLSTDALRFSHMPLGTRATKWINVSTDVPTKIIVQVSGNIQDFVYGNNSVILLPNEIKKLEVTMNIPLEAELGEYSGKLTVLFTRI
ncbi:hypothetical protein ACFLZ7_04300 [Nanoarchaeota archaeon]